MWTQFKLIEIAKKSVPSFKWVIGGAAIFGLAAIILKGGAHLATSILVAGILLVFAVALIVLNWVSKLRPGKTSVMAVSMAWSFLIILVASVSCLFFSAVLDWPWPVRTWISNQFKSKEEVEKSVIKTTASPEISSFRFPESPTFPVVEIELTGGESTAKLLVAKVAVSQVWETKSIWSYSGCLFSVPPMNAPLHWIGLWRPRASIALPFPWGVTLRLLDPNLSTRQR